jgi:2-dehydropantoate 2-reductase
LRRLARGARSEIDALNGFVVRPGAARGVPTPVNESLVALVKLREAQFTNVSPQASAAPQSL